MKLVVARDREGSFKHGYESQGGWKKNTKQIYFKIQDMVVKFNSDQR